MEMRCIQQVLFLLEKKNATCTLGRADKCCTKLQTKSPSIGWEAVRKGDERMQMFSSDKRKDVGGKMMIVDDMSRICRRDESIDFRFPT